jgi:hypothetical protein
LVEPQNQGRRFSGLGLKTGSSGLVTWVSKSLRRFFGLDIKTKYATVCRLRHKTDRRMIWRGGYTSRSSGLFHLKGSRARVFQSDLKTDEDVMMGGTSGIIMEVASSES